MSNVTDKLYNLQIKKVRVVNERIIADLINGEGSIVLSGDVNWVADTARARGYEIENLGEANQKVDAIMSNWGTF